MIIRRVSVDRLQPAPYNPRVRLTPGSPRYERLARSIDEFDLVQPAVWNERSGHIVGGHQRIEILRQRGVTEIDCVVVDLAPERERALNIALNNAHVGGEWDEARLIDLLDELSDVPEFDLTLTGFDEQQLRDLVLLPQGALPEPDPVPDDVAADDRPVTVILEMPARTWERLELRIDALVAEEPELEVHVQHTSD